MLTIVRLWQDVVAARIDYRGSLGLRLTSQLLRRGIKLYDAYSQSRVHLAGPILHRLDTKARWLL
jgi:hypothetical protein